MFIVYKPRILIYVHFQVRCPEYFFTWKLGESVSKIFLSFHQLIKKVSNPGFYTA